MPVTLQPVSRREFLARSLAAAAGMLALPRLSAQTGRVAPHRFALLADTHINADATTVFRETNMTDNLRRVVAMLTALDPLPSAIMVAGDLAHVSGEAGDYQNLVGLLQPVREAGMGAHLLLGNHDHRERFRAVCVADPDAKWTVANRHVAWIKTARAHFALLDSLEVTNQPPGRCGEAQLAWLTNRLDAHADSPIIVLVHHNPDEAVATNGLTDSRALFDVIVPRRQVKALVFGHTHTWNVDRRDGLHLINLPPTAYVFGADRPQGWVDLQLEPPGAQLTLRALDQKHPEHGKQVALKWRQ